MKKKEKESCWYYSAFKDASGWSIREIFRSYGKGIPRFLWSSSPEAPHGNTFSELVKCLEMMLRDVQHYSKYILKAEIQASNKKPKLFKGKEKPGKNISLNFENHREAIGHES